jgi:hypothetical protein
MIGLGIDGDEPILDLQSISDFENTRTMASGKESLSGTFSSFSAAVEEQSDTGIADHSIDNGGRRRPVRDD